MVEHFPALIADADMVQQSIEVFAPYDNTLIATVEDANNQSVESALSTAYAIYKDSDNWLTPEQRINILEKTAEIMASQHEQLALEAAREGGKPLLDSRVEVNRAIDGIKNCIDVLRTEHGEEIPMNKNAASANRLAVTRLAPIGVVVAVSAFNHPLNLAVHQIGPAIAAGCPVIIKPAPDTPLSCMRLVKILYQAGLPRAWCQAFCISDNALATQLVTDSRVAFFSFIGSAQVGWMLRSKLSPGTRCALEHGGVAPAIVEPDADLDDALPLLAKGGFYHAGQVCVSVQRIFVHHSIAETLAQKLAEIAQQLNVGDPTSSDTDVGPLIRPRETDRIHQWVKEAISEGATKLCGGKKLSDGCYAPTVLLNPADHSTLSQREIFGPVVCIYSYQDLDEALQRANALDVAFQAAVFTKNLDTAMHAYTKLDASAIMVNDHTAFRVDWMPFAGLNHSGLGIGGIPHTFKDMQVEKMLVIKSSKL